MKEKYKRSVDSGKLEFSKGPRYALVSNFSWNSVLSIEQAVKFSFNAKRQVTRATQIYIRGGKEHKSFSSDFRAKHFKSRTQNMNSELSNHMSASHNELDSIKILIKEKW